MWRAIRFGLDGSLIDLERGEEYPARAAIERLAAWTAPVRAELGIEPAFPERNGAQRQRETDRGGRHARGGLRGLGGGDPTDLFRGGGGVSTHADHHPTAEQARRGRPMSSDSTAGQAEQGAGERRDNRARRSYARPTKRN